MSKTLSMRDMSQTPALSAADRKRQQRARDKAQGYTQLTLRVPIERVDEVRKFVADLPPPSPRALPGQQSLFGGDWAEDDA
jgi:hypothetical protein